MKEARLAAGTGGNSQFPAMPGITDDGLRKKGGRWSDDDDLPLSDRQKTRGNAGFSIRPFQGLTENPRKCLLLRSGPTTSFLTITEKWQKGWALRSGHDHTLTTDFDGLSI